MENKSAEIKSLLDSRRVISHELGRLVYGSPEVREVNGEKYLYLHFRDGGLQRSNYLGKYNEDTHNLILNNNEKAKGLKSELRALDKKLKSLGYQPETLKDPVALNIDFARRHISDTIYAQAILEGVATTYAETKDIIEGAQVSGLSPDDIMKIVNLKHAWDFVLDQDVVMSGSDLSLLCQINKLIEEGFYYTAGKLRGVPVKIGGTTWSPELPVESRVKEDLASILLRHDSVLDRAIALLLFILLALRQCLEVFLLTFGLFAADRVSLLLFIAAFIIMIETMSCCYGQWDVPVDILEVLLVQDGNRCLCVVMGSAVRKLRAFLHFIG